MGTWTYTDGSQDKVTVNISVNLQISPAGLQRRGNLYSSSAANATGDVHIHAIATRTSNGFQDTHDFAKDITYQIGTGTPFYTDFSATDGSLRDMSVILLDPLTVAPSDLQPYKYAYDGAKGVLTVWIRLPRPFIYSVNDEAWQIPATATFIPTSSEANLAVSVALEPSTRPVMPGDNSRTASLTFRNIGGKAANGALNAVVFMSKNNALDQSSVQLGNAHIQVVVGAGQTLTLNSTSILYTRIF